MESLITAIVVLVISAIGTWLKKRGQQEQQRRDANAPPLAPGQPRPPVQKPVSWEDELRRLLGEEVPDVAPPRPLAPKPPPPPIVARPIPPPASPPPSSPARPPVTVRTPTPVVTKVPAPAIPATPATPAMPVSQTTSRVQTLQPRTVGTLNQAQAAEERVSRFDRVVAERVKKLPSEHIVPLTSVVKRTQPPVEAIETITLLRNARTARDAIIASIVIGPPRSLEES